VLAAHETPGPNAGSPIPRWCGLPTPLGDHEPARGRGGIPAAKQGSVPV